MIYEGVGGGHRPSAFQKGHFIIANHSTRKTSLALNIIFYIFTSCDFVHISSCNMWWWSDYAAVVVVVVVVVMVVVVGQYVVLG